MAMNQKSDYCILLTAFRKLLTAKAWRIRARRAVNKFCVAKRRSPPVYGDALLPHPVGVPQYEGSLMIVWILFGFVLGILCGLVLRPLFKLPQKKIPEPASLEEIGEIVERSSEAGELEKDEGELIQGVLDFSDAVVREVMTPRKDVIAVKDDAGLDEIMEIFSRERFSRILVIGESLDDVKGILLAKDLLPLINTDISTFNIKNYIRTPYTVQETMKADDLLREFRKRVQYFAVVQDEHGGTAGVVTVEDLVEVIVGEIFDEFDVPEEEIDIKEAGDGALIVDGGALIDDLNNEYSFDFPLGEYDTIAGLIMDKLGKIPEPGETVSINNCTIKVEEVEGHRIVQVRIIKSVLDEKR